MKAVRLSLVFGSIFAFFLFTSLPGSDLQADEIDEEEIRSTIPSDPASRGQKKSPPPPAEEPPPTSPPPSSPPPPADTNASDNGEEWRTMHSERSRPKVRKKPVSLMQVDLSKNRILPNVSFESNSENPTASSLQMLKQLAQGMTKKPELMLRVEGHSDSIGYDQPNLELSQKRADQIKEILMQNGVEGERLQAVGMGDRHPIASSTTREGQEKNRRVEFHIVSTATPPPVSQPVLPPESQPAVQPRSQIEEEIPPPPPPSQAPVVTPPPSSLPYETPPPPPSSTTPSIPPRVPPPPVSVPSTTAPAPTTHP